MGEKSGGKTGEKSRIKKIMGAREVFEKRNDWGNGQGIRPDGAAKEGCSTNQSVCISTGKSDRIVAGFAVISKRIRRLRSAV